MSRMRGISDSVTLEITCADTAGFLQKLGQSGVILYEIHRISELTVRFQCAEGFLPQIQKQTAKVGGSLKVKNTYGPGKLLHRLLSRPVITVAAAMLLFLALWLPARVLFIRVEGNENIPANLILEAAHRSGVSFGASRRMIRSESVKNDLLGEIPELQWVGINTSGCVATIHIREKTADESDDREVGIGNIIASRDGVIRSCTVLNGTALCRAGDAVIEGQTLVSGYTDCGITIKAVRAQAEISACTLRNLTAITPSKNLSRGSMLYTKTRYSLRVGKKLINFYKDSGISDTTCAKMYEEDYLYLPGGFCLPVVLVTEHLTYYATAVSSASDPSAMLEEYCNLYLLSHMQAGQILSQHSRISKQDDVCAFCADYVCLEMIGQFVDEEIVDNDGQTD